MCSEFPPLNAVFTIQDYEVLTLNGQRWGAALGWTVRRAKTSMAPSRQDLIATSLSRFESSTFSTRWAKHWGMRSNHNPGRLVTELPPSSTTHPTIPLRDHDRAHQPETKNPRIRGFFGRPLNYLDWDIGGARRDRTADLLHAMQALSQLSYSPTMRETRILGSVPALVNTQRDNAEIFSRGHCAELSAPSSA